ncbi:MAG: chromate transporter [Candidatus Izemoplasmatales bacterium]|nr:chromate transporter [Candidatus Izemoplasmatales bacterium]
MYKDLWILFITFFKIGLFTFGGGYAMIPMIEEEVLKHGWLNSVDLLVDFVAISESTPGPFAVNNATFIGFSQYGVLGAIITTLGVILPSFLIILFVAQFFRKVSSNTYVRGFLSGVRPIIIGILVSVAIGFLLRSTMQVSITHLEDAIWDYRSWIILAVVVATYLLKPKINPLYLILLSAGLGMIIYALL